LKSSFDYLIIHSNQYLFTIERVLTYYYNIEKINFGS